MRRNRAETVETRGDRVVLAQQAGMGRISPVSVLAGTLVAYGAFGVLLAITAAVADSVGFNTDLSTNEWQSLGAAGGAVVAVVLLACYLFGGYVAGRMARRAGAINGVMVFVLGVVGALGVAALVNAFTDGDEILRNLRNLGVPTSGSEWRDLGTVAGIGSLLAMLVGSVLGGAMGERWHTKLLVRAADPSVGPEADARPAADHHRRGVHAAEERSDERQREPFDTDLRTADREERVARDDVVADAGTTTTDLRTADREERVARDENVVADAGTTTDRGDPMYDDDDDLTATDTTRRRRTRADW